MSPSARTKRMLERDGWTVETVERRTGKVARDFLGCIDLLAMRGPDVLALQVTGGGNGPARVRKVEGCEAALAVMRECGWAIEVHDWRKRADGSWHLWRRDLS